MSRSHRERQRRRHAGRNLTARAALAAVALCLPGLASAATISVINDDPAGVGLNDTTPRSPVGGNPGETLGEQRLFAFRFATDLLADKLASNVEILVSASFASLECTSGSATLGRAGPSMSLRDFGAGEPDTFYPIALANALSGTDRAPSATDIGAEFNGDIDNNDNCLGNADWYYGVDGNPPPGDVAFISNAVHELIHGLGFISFANFSNGSFWDDTPGIFDRFVFDLDFGRFWPALTDFERRTSMTNDGGVVFDGPDTTGSGASALTDGVRSGRILLYAPSTVESGSSIGHWDTDLSPNALMEPIDTGDINVNNGIGLAACLLSDIGWNLIGGAGCPDNSTFTAEPILAASPDPLDFGTIEAGTSDTRTVTVSNSGNAGLTLDNIVAPGAPFSIVTQSCAVGDVLAPDESCGISIEFAPDSDGSFSDSLGIASDGGNESVALTGSAEPPPAPAIEVLPASLSFGQQTVGSITTRSFTVSNGGNANLDIGSLGAPATPFSLAPGGDACSGQTLAPGQSCDVAVRFQPDTAGSFGGSVSIPSNDTNASVTIDGSAVEDSGVAQLSVSPASLDFGEVTVGAGSSQAVTLSNTGAADLTISNIVAPSPPFSLVSATCSEGATLAPGQSCGITVSLAPTQTGGASDTLRVETDGDNEDIALTGKGIAAPAPAIAVDADTVDFGPVTIGDSAQQTVTVSNDGDADLILGTISTPNTPFAMPAGDDGCSGTTLPPSEQCEFTLGFAPTAGGSFSSTVTVPSNDSDIVVTLSGTGQEPATPDIEVSPTTVDFGDTGVGSAASRIIDVRNNGSTALQIGNLDLPAGPFSIAAQDCANRSVAMGTGCRITVRFAPRTTGGVSQDLRIASSDPDNPEILVSLTGNGVTDGDADGIPDTAESNAPNGGDGNGDGMADSAQAEVASLPGVRGSVVTLATDAGVLNAVRAEQAPSRVELPENVAFDNGFFGFEVTGLAPGASATVTLLLSATPDAYYKYPPGGTGSAQAVRFDFDEASGTGARIDGSQVTLHLRDGGRGDADMTANGVITDPGGPGFNLQTGGGNIDSGGGSGGGGGCVLAPSAAPRFDPSFLFMLMLAIAGLLRHTRHGAGVTNRTEPGSR